MRRLVELGIISRPHGYKGEFVVQTHSGQDSALSYLSEVFVGDSAETAQVFSIIEAAWMPKGWKLKLEGVESEDQVRSWQGHTVFAPRHLLKPTEDNEFYLADLEGAEVWDFQTQNRLGTFIGVESVAAGAPDRWWIEVEGEEIAFPATAHFIVKVDSKAKIIFVQNLKELE